MARVYSLRTFLLSVLGRSLISSPDVTFIPSQTSDALSTELQAPHPLLLLLVSSFPPPPLNLLHQSHSHSSFYVLPSTRRPRPSPSLTRYILLSHYHQLQPLNPPVSTLPTLQVRYFCFPNFPSYYWLSLLSFLPTTSLLSFRPRTGLSLQSFSFPLCHFLLSPLSPMTLANMIPLL